MVGGILKVGLYLFFLVIISFLIQAHSDTSTYSVPDYNEMPEMYREIVNEFDGDAILYELNPDSIYIDETGNYSEIILDDFYYTHNFGKPLLPMKYFEIPLPPDVITLKISVVDPSYTEINLNKKIKPYVPEERDSFDGFRYEIYDDYSSSSGIVTVDFGYRGEQKYALVRYHPFGYDSEKGKLNVTLSGVLVLEYDNVNRRTLYSLEEVSMGMQASSDGQGLDMEWEKVFGGSLYDGGSSALQTSDGGYIILGYLMVGSSTTNVYLIKTDSNGTIQWEKTFGGSKHDYSNSIQKTSDNGYIIAGMTNSFGAGIWDVYLIKTDSSGNKQWEKTFGGADYDGASSIQKTLDGGYIIAGWTGLLGIDYRDVYLIKTDSSGNNQWEKTFGGGDWDVGSSVQQTSDNGYLIAGYTESFGAGASDAYLVKTDSSGNKQWEKTFGGSQDDSASSIQKTSDNGYIIAGSTQSFSASEDVYLIKIDSNYNTQWERAFGGGSSDSASSVQQTSDNGYIIAGRTTSFGAGDNDVYLVKTDSNGTIQGEKTFGGGDWDVGSSVQQTSDDGYIIAGISWSYGNGHPDIYVIKSSKINPCSNGIKEGDETDIDCGGSCTLCSNGKSCLIDSDCESSYCNGGICETFIDLSVSSSDISFSGDDVLTTVRNNGKSFVDNVEVKFLHTNSGLIEEETVNIGSINGDGSKTTTVTFDLEIGDKVHVTVDPFNKIGDEDRSNNNVFKEYTGTLKYYVSADVPPSSSEIENYIKNGIKGEIVNNKEEADVEVLIARHNPLIMWHFGALEEEGWGFYGGGVRFQDEVCDKPYCGVVGDVENEGKKQIYIEANDVDGFIAASKEFVLNQDSFITGNTVFLGESDERGLSVYDYLHTSSNLPYYKDDGDEFKGIVGRALDGEMFDEEDGNFTTTISGQEVNLRYKHLAPEHNQKFLDYKDSSGYPVVMGGGIYSDISAWEELGSELSDEMSKDVWLIEITGGPDMECDTCPDYTYGDLTDNVWPTYINGIKTLSGKDKVVYFGHSNGARVGLSSLNDFYVGDSPVSTFVSVACPVTLNNNSYSKEQIVKITDEDYAGKLAINLLNSSPDKHITQREFAKKLNKVGSIFRAFFDNENKISINLQNFYIDMYIEDDTPTPFNLVLDHAYLYAGDEVSFFHINTDNDDAVPVSDIYILNKSINSPNKIVKIFHETHSSILGSNSLKKEIKGVLK